MIFYRLLHIAARNLARNRRRSIFTFTAIAVGAAMLIFLDAVNSGISSTLMDRLIHAQVGDIGIFRKDYQRLAKAGRLTHLTVPYTEEISASLKRINGIEEVTGRIVFQANLTNGIADSSVTMTAIDPANEIKVCPNLNSGLEKNSLPLTPDDAPHSVLLNSDLAEAFAKSLGSGSTSPEGSEQPVQRQMGALTLVATNRYGGTNSIDVRTKGYTPTIFGMKQNYLSLADAQDLLGMNGVVTELVAKVSARANLQETGAKVQELLGPDFEVKTWKQLMPEVEDEIRRQEKMSRVVSLLLMSLVIFGITNTMIMCVQERLGEIGTMMALGMRSYYIFILFAEEALIIGLIGSVVGALSGVGLSLAANHFTIPLGSSSPIFADGLRPVYDVVYVSITMLFVIGAAFLGGLLPAIQAAQKKPVDALAQNI